MNKGWIGLSITIILASAPIPVAVRVGQERRETPSTTHGGKLPDPILTDAYIQEYRNLPLQFEANQGQTDDRVKFLSRGSGYLVFLTSEEAVLAVRPPTGKVDGSAARKPGLARGDRKSNSQPSTVVRMKLVGANRSAQVRGVDELPGKSNYFRGNDPTKWRTNVPTYARVEYIQVLPGVDLVYYGNSGQLEYDFVIAPGASPRAIHMSVEGAEKVEVTPGGDLQVCLHDINLYLKKPTISQMHGHERRDIEGGYRLEGANKVSFRVGAYDASEPLVIDPVLTYATYLAGMSSDFATGIQVDVAGNTYLTGETQSSDFPPGPPNTSSGRAFGDVFVTKINFAGTAVVFTTFLSGSNLDVGNALALDPSGNIYVTGETASPDFPIVNPLHSTCNNCPNAVHGFVTKLDPSGSTLVYSTFIAGSGNETGYAITADSGGNAYVAGVTKSQDFPTTPGALQPSPGDPVSACQIQAFDTCGDGFAAKIKPDGSAFVYATYLGGSLYDHVSGIAVDASGNAYVTGRTYSQNFPTTSGAFVSNCDPTNVCNTLYLNPFVTKLNATGSAVIYSSYLTGSSSFADSYGSGISVDASGNAYVTGTTGAANFPTTAGAFQQQCVKDSSGFCITSAFVSKFNATGSSLVYSTRIGGNGGESGSAIVVDAAGNAFIAGTTGSTDFPLVAPVESCLNGTPPVVSSGFLTELNPQGSAPVYSTCIGGGLIRVLAGALAVDSEGAVYLTGGLQRIQRDLPTTAGAFQTALQISNISAAYVMKVSPASGAAAAFDSHSLTFTDQTVGTTSGAAPIDLYSAGSAPLNLGSVVATGDFNVTHNCGSSVAGASSCTLSVTFIPTATGTRTGTVVVTDNAADSPQTLQLSGTGINPAVTLSPGNLTFGSQQIGTSSSVQNITLANSGVGPLVLTMITPQPPGDFQESDNCLGVVAQGSSCTLNVRFTPTAGGTRSATLALTDNAQNSPQLVPLTGTGTGPGISFSTTNVVFPSQPASTTSAPQNVTLTNNGTATLTISNIQLPPAFSQSNTCGSSVAAGVNCILSLTFAPPTPGNYQGALAISDNVPTSPQSITLSGSSSGTSSASLSPTSLSFGTVLEGTTSMPQSVTFSNTGNAPLNISAISVVGVDYTQTNNCGSSVAAGVICTINVSYAPTSSGTNQTRIDITDDAANSPQSIALSGTGTEFLLTPAAGAPTSQTVNAGATANYSLTLTPSATTRDTVTLACSGAPSAAVCSVSPAQQTFGSSAAVAVSVSVTTASRAALPLNPGFPLLYPLFRYLVVLSMLIVLSKMGMLAIRVMSHTGDRLIRRPANCLVFALSLLPILFIGCGGGGSSPLPPRGGGTPAGNYTLTVTAVSASSPNPNQAVSLSLKVN
jgi:hypothetical protein